MRSRLLGCAVAGACALGASLTPSSASAAQVAYYGGRVISNVEIVEVSWTSSVNAAYLQQLQGFYQAVVTSPFMDWMSEYDTIGKTGLDGMPGSNQHIGRGTFGGLVTITPLDAKVLLGNEDIAAEVAAQITSGGLPPPKLDESGNVNTLYMIEFPPGYFLNLDGEAGCTTWGAFHSTTTVNGLSVPYSVHPFCNYQFADNTPLHSHELAEAVTDMEIGIPPGNTPTRPLAWGTVASDWNDMFEVGDLCESISSPEMVAGYWVQKIWSNYANGCVAQIPICDGSSAPPACRSCLPQDSGVACTGAAPACATSGAKGGQCVACAVDSDCGSGNLVCDQGTNTCRGCTSDTDCPSAHCDLSPDAEQGGCVACNADADCGANSVCKAHVCADAPTEAVTSSSSGVDTTTTGGGGSSGVGSVATTGGAAAEQDDATTSGDVAGSCACRAATSNDGGRSSGVAALAAIIIALSSRRRRR